MKTIISTIAIFLITQANYANNPDSNTPALTEYEEAVRFLPKSHRPMNSILTEYRAIVGEEEVAGLSADITEGNTITEFAIPEFQPLSPSVLLESSLTVVPGL